MKDTLTNIALILRYDPQLKNIVFNEFKCMVDVIGPLPVAAGETWLGRYRYFLRQAVF